MSISSIRSQFKYYKQLGEKTFEQVTDENLFWKSDDDANAIANIVFHLRGNMLSRWTDFLNSDGEKEWRRRDEEFENAIQDRAALIKYWNEGWTCLLDALEPLNEEDLKKTVYIRNEGHTVLEALHRQLAHYAYHIGQIVYLGRMLKGKEWTSLSIPKGESKSFNKQKFDQPKSTKHFTKDLLE